MTGPEDRLFAKFRLTGSPRALGQVYDLVAPELLEVAGHLAGDPLDAEDLVQRTFVTAIERAPSFREDARVLPWLLGILAHHAREERRRHGRRPDPMKLELRRQLRPDDAAEAGELDEHIERGLAALSEEQRSVLTLRLRHGLSAAEIAAALGRPPGTVRSQLARGVEKLRETLPAGLVASAALAFGLPRGLSIVRASVLETASASALPKLVAAKGYLLWAAAPLTEIVIMKKLALAAVVLIGSFVGLDYALRDGAAPGSRAVSPGSVQAPLPAHVEARGTTARDSETREVLATEERAAVTAEAPASTADARDQVEAFGSLRIRVRDSFGAPVEGEVCIITTQPPGTASTQLLTARTAMDGVALLERVPVGNLLVRPLRGSDRPAVVRGQQTTSLEFELARGIEVQGVVLDGSGEPVPYADIWLSERWNTKRGYPITRTDVSGNFRLPSVSRDNYVGAFARGHGISYLQAPRGVTGEVATLEIVLDTAGGDVQVEVVDALGAPIEGAEVLIGDEGHSVYRKLADGWSGPPAPPRRGRTDSSGSVTLDSIPVGRPPVLARKRGYGLARSEVEVFAEQLQRVRVTLLPEAGLTGVVTDGDELPVAGAHVWTGVRHHFDSSHGMTDRDGRYTLSGLSSDELLVKAERRGQGKVQQELQLIPGEERVLDLQLVVQPMIFGQLVDHQGRGVSGYTLVAREDEGQRRHVDTDSTNRRGEFSLEVAADTPHSIIVRKPGDWRGFPLLIEPGLEASETSVFLGLPRQGIETVGLSLRALAPDGTPALGSRLELWHQELKIWRSFEPAEETADFQLEELAPGTFQVTVRHPQHPMIRVQDLSLEPGEQRDLGDQRFEASGRLSGRLVGLDDAALLAGLEAHISRSAGGGFGSIELTGTTFKSSPLQQGKHSLSFLGDFVLPVYRVIEIEPGQHLELEIPLVPAGLRRIVVEAREGEAPSSWVGGQAWSEDGRVVWSGGAKRLEDGDFEFRVSVLPGSYRFEASDDRGRQASRTFDVLDLRGEQPAVNLRLDLGER